MFYLQIEFLCDNIELSQGKKRDVMKTCKNCGKEIIGDGTLCEVCAEQMDNVVKNGEEEKKTNNGTKKKNKMKIILPIVGAGVVVLAFVLGITIILGVLLLGGNSYKKVTENYLNALLSSDYITYHETTIFNEEEMDKALSGYYNEKNVSVEDIYKCASVEYFAWTDEFENYEDFYNNLSEVDKASRENTEYKIIDIIYTEMTQEEIADVGYQYGLFQQYYTENYNLDDEYVIDFEEITEGYNAVATVLIGQQTTTYNVSVVKYNGEWFAADCMCLERIAGLDIFKISVLKEGISEEKLESAFLSLNYQVTPYSINVGRVIPRCSPDYEMEFLRFDEAKNDMLTQSQIEKIEQSGVWDTDNIYFAVATGTCIYNPNVSDYKSEEQVLMKIMLVFNDDEELTNKVELYLSPDVISYATNANMVDIVF